MATEFKVRDESIESVISYLQRQANRYEEALASYISVLEEIRENGIKEGTTAEALSVFLSNVQNRVDAIPEQSRSAANKLKSFLLEVDDADKYLY